MSVFVRPSPVINEAPLSEHPAVCAWNKVASARAKPVAVETLQRRTKSAIYRVAGVGPGGSAVIAKRAFSIKARIEQTIYDEILPSLSLPALRCFGFVEDLDAQYSWLFLEDAGTELYTPGLREHRAAGTRWLARLHTSAASLAAAPGLPDRGPGFYLCKLRQARENVSANLAHPFLEASGRALLEEVLALCAFVESSWDEMERRCEGKPSTFVHGDLKERNIRVRRTSDGIALLVFDWEFAGWGSPGPDLLKCPDLSLYLAEAQTQWPDLTLGDLLQLANVGQVFRAVIGIYWESLALSYDEVQWPVLKIRPFRDRLVAGLKSLGLAPMQAKSATSGKAGGLQP